MKKKEHPELPKMRFSNFVLLLWVIFALLDPDPIRIHNTAGNCYRQTPLVRQRSFTSILFSGNVFPGIKVVDTVLLMFSSTMEEKLRCT
jgi:hypothetical protein